VQLSRSQIKYDTRRVTQIASRLQAHMELYGYEIVETPIIDAAELFLTQAGDQIITRLFTFERHGQQLALRPEFTAPAVYRYVTAGNGSVARWQFSGVIFEDDPHDLTRHYQRYSVGAELIGMGGAAAEAEIIAMAAQGIAQQNVTDWRIVIGHIGLLRALLGRFRLDRRTERFLLNHRALLKEGKERLLQKIDGALLGSRQTADSLRYLGVLQNGQTFGGRTESDILRRLEEKRSRAAQHEQVLAALDFLERWSQIGGSPQEALQAVRQFTASDSGPASSIVTEWEQLLRLLDIYGIPPERILLRPDLMRNWEYYTGMVFELVTESGIDLGGGGRYDDLTGLIGEGHDIPAVGFVYYIDPLIDVAPPQPVDAVHFIRLSAELAEDAARWTHLLRERGIPTVLMPTKQDSGLHIDVQGNAHRGEKTYSSNQIDLLISDWESSR
jgi:histidyl-tRNA synthetase